MMLWIKVGGTIERMDDDKSSDPRAAAFFDLDKTLLAKSSTLAYARPLQHSGLLKRRDALRSAYAQMVYQLSGADHDDMEQARVQLSALVTGWDVEQVRAVVAEALDQVIEPIVYAEGISLIEEHHAAGRDVIIVSSSGNEVIEPIGELLGVDHAIGTQMAIEDGKYTGEVLFYAYAEGKVTAMQSLAEDQGYDLGSSYAYSDSITDLPMLEVVGHPFATNPDKALREVAEDRGWPILKFDTPVSLKEKRAQTRKRTAAAGAGAAVALGLAWYARSRMRR